MINIDYLYIVEVGKVKEIRLDATSNTKYLDFHSEDSYFVAARLKNNTYVEVFTGNIYENPPEKGSNYVGRRYVVDAVSITRYMSKVSGSISEVELTEILRRKNKMLVSEEDYFLQALYTLYHKVLSRADKDYQVDRLRNIANEYLSALIVLKEGGYKEANNDVDEAKLKLIFFNKLINFEQSLNLYGNSDSKDFTDYREQMMRLLK